MTENLPPLDLAPGCFGLALTFSAESAECKTCEFAVACEPIHLIRRENLNKSLGINPKTQRQKTKKTRNPVAETLLMFNSNNILVADAFTNGTNPFDNSFPKLKLASHILLNMSGRVDDALLQSAFKSKMDMQDDEAKKAVSYVISTLYATGAIFKENGKYNVRKYNGC